MTARGLAASFSGQVLPAAVTTDSATRRRRGVSGPEGVRDAIELHGADRIDHGVRAIEAPSVVALLADRRTPLGVCPTSNLSLDVYPSMTSISACFANDDVKARLREALIRW